ncbi:MAG: hypothetical protein IT198_14670 [Acidimicrobiia bacterium]|nr:hypothetical protein [Acidimicrobiia bacterium]
MGTPARADGLDLTCSTGSTVADIDTSQEPQVLDGVDVVFRGRAAPSVPVTGAVEIDPETGDKLFSRTWRPTSGGTFYVDFLDSQQPEMSFLLRPRVHAGWGGPVPYSMGLADLLGENFALPHDYRTNPLLPPNQVGLVGLDVSAFASEALAALPEGIEGRLEVHVRFHRSDGTWTATRIGVGLDSRADGADMPRRTDVGVGFKRVWTGGAGTPTDYIVVGQHFLSWTEEGPRPGVGLRVDVDDVLAGPEGETERPVVDVDLDYSHAPENMAVGLRSRCQPWDPAFDSTGHLAWNHSGLDSEAAAATNLDLKVRSGIAAGLPIRISEFDPYLGGGTRDIQADEIDVDATITGLPERLDWIMHPDSMGITRSDDVTPDITLHHAALAQDDPAVTTDKPLYVEGKAVGVPSHSRIQAGFGTDGGLTNLDVRFSSTTCGAGTPEDDLFPPGPDGCRRDAPVALPEATVAAQNWLPQDLIAEGAWSGMASPPLRESQYFYYASRDQAGGALVNLWRMAARVVGVRQVAYDAPAAGRIRVHADRDESYVVPPESPSPGPGGCIPLPPPFPPEDCRPWPGPGPIFTDPDPAHVSVDVDSSTSDDEVADTGTRVVATGKVPDLPGALRLDFETGAEVTKVRWWASHAIDLDDGRISADLPGPEAVRVDAALAIGGTGQGLPASGEVSIEEEFMELPLEPLCLVILGRRICYTPRGTVRFPTGWSQVAYRTPAAPADGFPVPAVPETASDSARVHAGAVITNRAERLTPTRLRLWVNADVSPGAVVRWFEGDGTAPRVSARLCSDPADCPANRFDGTVVVGPPVPFELDHLAERPDLPAVPTPVAEVMPAFSDDWWWDEEPGVRAILAGDGVWGVNGYVRNVATFDFSPVGGDRTDVTVVLAEATADEEQPFNVDLLDASRRRDFAVGHGYVPLMVDAELDRLPQQMRARIEAADPAAADAPLVWVNTEDVEITDPADVDWTTTDGSGGGRPHLTGVVRAGDVALLGLLPAGSRPTPPRTASGADVWALFSVDSGHFGVDVAADLVVPRHVALWQPAIEECKATQDRDRVAACQNRPLYEMDEWTEIQAEYRTTSTSLGDLNLQGRLAGADLDFDVAGRIEHVPGQLDAVIRITQNRRLPWLEATVDLNANTALGEVSAAVTDRRDPTPSHYRLADGTTRTTPNYAAVLDNVGRQLDLSARVLAAEPRLTPTPDTGDGGDLGYLHALLDLAEGVTDVDIDVSQSMSGGLAADVRADAPVSGWVNVKMDHIQKEMNPPPMGASPFWEFLKAGGISNAILTAAGTPDYGWAVVGEGFLFWPWSLLFAPFFDLFLPNSVVLEVALDLDMPLVLEFDSIEELRVAMNGTTLSVDERHGDSGGDPTTIAVRQRSLPDEEPLSVDGAWYHSRDVRFYTTDGVFETFDIREEQTNRFGVVGLHPWQLCFDNAPSETGTPCFSGARSRDNAGTLADFATSPRGDGFRSADIVIDPVFSPASRAELVRQDGSLVKPGVGFYGVLTKMFTPAVNGTFTLPVLEPASRRSLSSTRTFNVESLLTGSTGGCVPSPDTAAGSDGTVYRLVVGCQFQDIEVGQFNTVFSLAAEHANAVPRWVVALPEPVGFGTAVGSDTRCVTGANVCRVSARVSPAADGSVQVTLRSEIRSTRYVMGVPRDSWSSLGTKYAWLDASGQPAHHRAPAGEVSGLAPVPISDSSTREGVVTLDPCRIAAWACGAPAAGHTTRLVFGDGVVSDPAYGPPGPVVHDYPSTRTRTSFYGMLLELDAQGEVVRYVPFRVSTGGFSIWDLFGPWFFPIGP